MHELRNKPFSYLIVVRNFISDGSIRRQFFSSRFVPSPKCPSIIATIITLVFASQASAMGKPNRGGGVSNFNCDTADFFIVPGDLDTVVDANNVGQKQRQYVSTGSPNYASDFETFLGSLGEPIPPEKECSNPSRYGYLSSDSATNEAVGPPISGWTKVFEDTFDAPPITNPDLSNSFNALKWSSKYPFSLDAKINTIPGEDDHWNVNTTGRYPGETNYDGMNPDAALPNFFGNSSQLNFIDALFDIPNWGTDNDPNADLRPVFSNSDGTLSITAFENPPATQIKNINQSKEYLSGLISTAANPDSSKDASVPAHGFEFRYGYVEASAKLPVTGNGFRAALWLYSDNAFFNQISSANNVTHEIDFMEYLPNTEVNALSPSYKVQSSLFGGVDNLNRVDPWKIMTYDTIFHAYHYDNNARRTPTNWTFNGEARYQNRRLGALGEQATVEVKSAATADFHKFGVLWLPDRIEWYVNDVLIHRAVLPEQGEIPGFQAEVDHIFDKRMYIIANLAMGLDAFEGPMDPSVYNGDGRGPSLEIDYIKVYQDLTDDSHVHCGVSEIIPVRCNTTIGIPGAAPDPGGDGGGGGGGGGGGSGRPGGGKGKPNR